MPIYTLYSSITDRCGRLVLGTSFAILVQSVAGSNSNPAGDLFFIMNLWLVSRSSQFGEAHANDIKLDQSPVLYLDTRYDYSHNAYK